MLPFEGPDLSSDAKPAAVIERVNRNTDDVKVLRKTLEAVNLRLAEIIYQLSRLDDDKPRERLRSL